MGNKVKERKREEARAGAYEKWLFVSFVLALGREYVNYI